MKAKKNKNKQIKKMAKKPKKILIRKKKKNIVKKAKPKIKFKPKKKIIKKKTVRRAKKVVKPVRGRRISMGARKNQTSNGVKKKTVKKIIARKPKAKKNQAPAASQDSLVSSFFRAKIKVIGIGGGGGSIVSEIGRSLHKATFVVADTDTRAFKKRVGIKNFLFGQELTHGLGTGVNPQLGRQAAESEKERIVHLFDDQDIVIFIASLGGGLGSGATQVFADAVKDFNGITLGIFTLPFKFEGSNKYKIALKALRELRKVLNVSITIPNERIFKIIEANTAITDAFSIVNKNLIESLESLIDLIYSPGIINIDFADLRAILAGRGNLAFLNTTEASGKDRADQVAQKILHNSLYQNNNFTAEKILFNITGGANLSMFEVDKISRAISEKNKKAKIIFGISKDLALKNKIKTTLLMTSQGVEAKPEEVILTPNPQEIILDKSEKPKKVAKKKVVTEKKKVIKKVKKRKKVNKKKIPFFGTSLPVFPRLPFANEPVQTGLKKINITQSLVKNDIVMPTDKNKQRKAIRRTALEIKKEEELRENEQSLQEKEWEIPAFLRLKK